MILFLSPPTLASVDGGIDLHEIEMYALCPLLLCLIHAVDRKYNMFSNTHKPSFHHAVVYGFLALELLFVLSPHCAFLCSAQVFVFSGLRRT